MCCIVLQITNMKTEAKRNQVTTNIHSMVWSRVRTRSQGSLTPNFTLLIPEMTGSAMNLETYGIWDYLKSLSSVLLTVRNMYCASLRQALFHP